MAWTVESGIHQPIHIADSARGTDTVTEETREYLERKLSVPPRYSEQYGGVFIPFSVYSDDIDELMH